MKTENSDSAKMLKKDTTLRSNLQRYIPSELVNKIINGEVDVDLGGQFRKVTVQFSEIVNFVSLTKKLNPQQLLNVLNDYFTLMVDTIFRYEGTVDKFISDSIMAVWGAPVKTSMDELLAIHAGIEMQSMLHLFNKRLIDEGVEPMQMHIGINTGQVLAGTIGSDQRQEYTVIGDIVDSAREIEGLTEPGHIYIGEGTYQEVHEFVMAFSLGKRKLRRQKDPVQLYSVRGIFPQEIYESTLEKRKDPRMFVTMEAHCSIEGTGDTFDAVVTNLSKGGSGGLVLQGEIFSQKPLEEGTKLSIQFKLNEVPQALEAFGEVRRIDQITRNESSEYYRLGIQFTGYSEETKEILDILWKR